MKAYDPQKRVVQILSYKEVQEAIISLIQKRIFDTGKLSDGFKLRTDSAIRQGGYSYSKNNKLKSRYSHVNLFITGDFYESWKLSVGQKVTNVLSNDIGEIYKNFKTSFSNSKEMMDKIGTLTPQEIEIVKDKIIMPYIKEDLKQILNVQM